MQAPLWGSPWEAGWTDRRDRAPGRSLPTARGSCLGWTPSGSRKQAARQDLVGMVHTRTLERGSCSGSPGVLPGQPGSGPGVPGLPAGDQAPPGPAGSEGSAHTCPRCGRRPVRARGQGCRTGSLPIRAMTTAFLLLSGYHRSFRPDWPPGSPWPAGAYLEGWVVPWAVLGERGGSGHGEAVGPQSGVCGPPGLFCSLSLIRVLSDGDQEVGHWALISGAGAGGEPLSPGILGHVDSPL